MKPGPKPDNKTKQINIRVEDKIFREITTKARAEGRAISEIIRGLLVGWLRGEKYGN